jgi:repressor LexA
VAATAASKRRVEVGVRQLSQRQEAILGFINDYMDEHGYPPSMREIGAAARISSTSVVDYNLRVLERHGYLRRDREVSRGLELSASSERFGRSRVVRVPLVGRIAAGEPIEAIEREEEAFEFSASLVPEGCYALQVKGTSMIDDLIDDGDVVVVRPQATADNGEIVVALLLNEGSESGSATLKRVYRERGRVRLQPANSSMEPIYVNPDELLVQGKVVALLRQM